MTIVELLSHCLQVNFDDEFCIMAEEKLRELRGSSNHEGEGQRDRGRGREGRVLLVQRSLCFDASPRIHPIAYAAEDALLKV